VHLVLVTGKGGVGKTTVAAALGRRCAAAGLRTLVCSLARGDQLARLCAGAPGRRLRTATVEPDEALAEWLARTVGRPAAALIGRSGAAAAFVAAAPGARELVAIGKVCDLTLTPAHPRLDVVVFDAPATGHLLALVEAPRTYAALARGPVGIGAQRTLSVLRSRRATTVVGVAAPTELAVAETLELDRRLRELLGRGLSVVVVDGVLEHRFADAELERIVASPGLPRAVRRACRAQAARDRTQRPHLSRLRRSFGHDVLELPYLFTPMLGPAEAAVLADILPVVPRSGHGRAHGFAPALAGRS
jgi:hypothetical protein